MKPVQLLARMAKHHIARCEWRRRDPHHAPLPHPDNRHYVADVPVSRMQEQEASGLHVAHRSVVRVSCSDLVVFETLTGKMPGGKVNGILVGFDFHHEEMALYFLRRYHRFTKTPIAIADFGVTEKFKNEFLVPITEQKGTPLYRAPIITVQAEGVKGWHLKPFAFAQSPFDRTMWMDVDIVIRKDPAQLLDQYKQGFVGSADPYMPSAWLETPNTNAAPWTNFQVKPMTVIGTGCFVADTHSPLISEWCRIIQENPKRFRGDMEALATLIRCGWTAKPEFKPVVVWPPKAHCTRLYPVKHRGNCKLQHYNGPEGHAELISKFRQGFLT